MLKEKKSKSDKKEYRGKQENRKNLGIREENQGWKG